jgi:hypothetical protein
MTETLTLEAPAPLTFSDEMGREAMPSERAAKLLEAGDYPDKDLCLTEDDLDGIVARFTAGVPVKVEHVDSPLDPLGEVKRLWRDGVTLFGTLAFPDDLAGFLKRRGAAKLSVGLARDPLALLEVSLVLKPRIPSAALMHSGVEMTEDSLRAEVIRLSAALTARDVAAQVDAFKVQGRIVPASEAPARALLAAVGEATVTLSEGPEPISRVFRRFLEAQPPVVSFGESIRTDTAAGSDGFTQYEHTFLVKQLGVDPVKVAALIREEAEKEAQQKAQKEAQKETSHAH